MQVRLLRKLHGNPKFLRATASFQDVTFVFISKCCCNLVISVKISQYKWSRIQPIYWLFLIHLVTVIESRHEEVLWRLFLAKYNVANIKMTTMWLRWPQDLMWIINFKLTDTNRISYLTLKMIFPILGRNINFVVSKK